MVVSASKRRPRWEALPASVRSAIEGLVGGRVAEAAGCAGGFSPGLASRLRLSDGRWVFVKGMDGVRWPHELAAYRDEARVAAALPEDFPAPRLIGSAEQDGWLLLAFAHVDGREPVTPWTAPELTRVIAALHRMQEMPAPALDLPREHPRLGGWADVADDTELAKHSRWAAANLPLLVSLEQTGLRRAQGDVLVHFDLYPHNILLVPQRVWFVDWPHARFGSALVDLVLLLSSVAADGLDPEPFVPDSADPEAIDGILAAHTGALVGSSLHPPPPGLEPIFHTKLAIGLSALGWLRRRIRA